MSIQNRGPVSILATQEHPSSDEILAPSLGGSLCQKFLSGAKAVSQRAYVPCQQRAAVTLLSRDVVGILIGVDAGTLL